MPGCKLMRLGSRLAPPGQLEAHYHLDAPCHLLGQRGFQRPLGGQAELARFPMFVELQRLLEQPLCIGAPQPCPNEVTREGLIDTLRLALLPKPALDFVRVGLRTQERYEARVGEGPVPPVVPALGFGDAFQFGIQLAEVRLCHSDDDVDLVWEGRVELWRRGIIAVCVFCEGGVVGIAPNCCCCCCCCFFFAVFSLVGQSPATEKTAILLDLGVLHPAVRWMRQVVRGLDG
mmetsp:Transcript_81517/g.170509  ORF Transcript_81517/g.170509 Transcript_81517/m.170509 type:complete len:232 (+) Transcript_81517:1855-2550(+)